MAVFVWSIYNGATYYIDIFGKRFQNELEQLKRDVTKWQASPDIAGTQRNPSLGEDETLTSQSRPLGSAITLEAGMDRIPPIDANNTRLACLNEDNADALLWRKVQ
jgi:hypothetical protein